MAFEASQRPRFESDLANNITEAEARLRIQVVEVFKNLSTYTPAHEIVEKEDAITSERRTRRIEALHAFLHGKLLGVGLLPSTLAFIGFGYIKNNAGNLGSLDGHISSVLSPALESAQIPDLSVVQSFAESGMASSAVAAGVMIFLAGMNTEIWKWRTRKTS